MSSYAGALREARDHGLVDRAAQIHAYATWWLSLMGYSEPQRPDIISGRRSLVKQWRLRRRWILGDRQGLAAEPACRSRHTTGRAWDVQTDVSGFGWYKQIVQWYGARWGGTFGDPPHFDLPGGPQPTSIC